MNPTWESYIYLVNGLNISPHIGGDVAKVAGDVFSGLPEARYTVGLAKISNMMKDCITYSLTNTVCTRIRKPIKKNSRTRVFHSKSGVNTKAYLRRKHLHLYCSTPT